MDRPAINKNSELNEKRFENFNHNPKILTATLHMSNLKMKDTESRNFYNTIYKS